MKAKDRRLEQLKAIIPEVTPAEAVVRESHGAIIVDIRETEEVARGSPANALRLQRAFLEMQIEDHVADTERVLLLICATGVRSLFAADNLKQLGYRNVYSIEGGFERWKKESLPFDIPRILDSESRERYARHLTLPNVGQDGQLKLLNSKVLLIGAGGLGSPAALYLGAAGIGTLGIVDFDVVERSNLQRQVLHTEQRIGQSKVESAREAINALNPSVNVVTYPTRLSANNVEDIFKDYDIVIDGSDNLATRYLVNDACVQMGLPNVHGAVHRFEGQVTVFWNREGSSVGDENNDQASPCYRCLYPEPPSEETAPSCNEAGVLGVLPGIIGLLQAVETVKIILGIGQPLIGKMLYYDALSSSFMQIGLKQDSLCPCCSKQTRFDGYTEYQHPCTSNMGTSKKSAST